MRSLSKPPEIDLENPMFATQEGGEQLETAFKEVKAELAAGRGVAARLLNQSSLSGRTKATSSGVVGRLRSASVDGAPPPRTLFEEVGAPPRAETNGPEPVPSTYHASRAEAIKVKVDSLNEKIAATEAHLNGELRVARNLAVLAPFRTATRERIQMAVIPLAKRVRHLRIELARLRCYREILAKDLTIEAEAWKALKHIAHQAAQSSLASTPPIGSSERLHPFRPPPDSPMAIPDLHVSEYTGLTPPRGTGLDHSKPIAIPSTACGRQPASSASVRSSIASYHSAIEDLGGSSPDSDGGEAGAAYVPSPSTWPQPLDANTPPSPQLLVDNGLPTDASPSAGTASRRGGDKDRIQSLESAEDWNATRAAKRVSLAHLPTESVRRISLRLKRESVDGMRARAALSEINHEQKWQLDADENADAAGTVSGPATRLQRFERRASVGRRARSASDVARQISKQLPT